jgi:hypothetical protein
LDTLEIAGIPVLLSPVFILIVYYECSTNTVSPSLHKQVGRSRMRKPLAYLWCFPLLGRIVTSRAGSEMVSTITFTWADDEERLQKLKIFKIP